MATHVNAASITELENDPAIEALLRRAAEASATEARRLCPVRSGKLRNSIEVKVVDGKISFGSDLDYANFVEYGSYNHAAQPYLRPAISAIKQVT